MNKKTRIVFVLTLILLCVTMALPVYAAWTYSFPITITDTSGVARTNLSVLTGISGTTLNTSGYMAANGLNTNMQSGTSSISFMMVTNQVPVFISSLPASGSVTVNLYTGYSPAQTVFPVLVGNNGYVTTADAAALEPAANFEFEISGYFDTTNSPTYTTGTVTTNSTGAIVGTDTVWNASMVGAYIAIDGEPYHTIIAVADTTHLTIETNATTGDAGNTYVIYHKQVFSKLYDIRLYVSSSGNVTADMGNLSSTATFKSVTCALASGVHTVKLTAGSDVFKIYVDDVEKDSEDITGVSANNDNTSWLINTANVLPYMSYYKETVSSTQVLWYQPNTMVITTALLDRSTADGTQNGVITYGSNAGMTISFGEQESSSSTSYNPSTSFGGTSAPSASLPSNWWEGTISPNSPLYGMFNNAASTSGMPVGTLYFVVDITLVIVLMLIAGVMTHSNMFMLLIGLAMIGISVNQGVIGGYAGVIFVVGTLSIVYLRRQM